MPRLTHSTYVNQRDHLREIWNFSGGAFSLLTPKEQWDLHNFYLVTQEMNTAELRLHRRVVKRIDPSLPQRAGRAYAKLERGKWETISYVVTPKGRAISVRSLAKPRPDLRKLVRGLLRMAHEHTD